MPVATRFVSANFQPAGMSEMPGTLESISIHPIWRRAAFRMADFSSLLDLPTLDHGRYDMPPELYDRMKPALRLATLFMSMTVTDLAKIKYGEVKPDVCRGGVSDRVFADPWRVTGPTLATFDRDLARLCSTYRITLLGSQARTYTCPATESATTTVVRHECHQPPVRKMNVQSAINTSNLHFLSRLDWETMPLTEKYIGYFLMAAMLVHEFAHAVWQCRMLPLLEKEFQETGHLTIANPEPRFSPLDGFRELGYAIEMRLLGGLPSFPHSGRLSAAEKASLGNAEHLLFTSIDTKGRALAVHPIDVTSIMSLFADTTWNTYFPWSIGPVLRLWPDIKTPGRPWATLISHQHSNVRNYIPVVKSPHPRQLKPAINEFNPLFFGEEAALAAIRDAVPFLHPSFSSLGEFAD